MQRGARILLSIVFSLVICMSFGVLASFAEDGITPDTGTYDMPSENTGGESGKASVPDADAGTEVPIEPAGPSDPEVVEPDPVVPEAGEGGPDAGESDADAPDGDAIPTDPEVGEPTVPDAGGSLGPGDGDSDETEPDAGKEGLPDDGAGVEDDDETDDLAEDEDADDDEADPGEEDLAVCELEPGSAVYVNGTTGSDDNPGTQESPVKTFAKAKELLGTTGGSTIYVAGTIYANGSETWSLDGNMLMRAPGFSGEIIHIGSGASLTLGNIVVDGGIGNGSWAVCTGGLGNGASLVGVYGGGALTVTSGAVLQNNWISSLGHWYPEAGGAIFAQDSGTTVNIIGGTISNNSAVRGGGVYGCNDATISMSGGTIMGNHAVESASNSLAAAAGGCGGGICVADGANIRLSGGSITGNDAYERGGGISVGTYYLSTCQSSLTMTGGNISGNTAGCSGGGIFLQCGTTSTYSVAYISGGTISYNSMMGGGDGNKLFGGGGIYVNGIGDTYAGFHDAELYLTNVEVSGNSATITGGGYASCPSSSTVVSLTDGAVFFGNAANQGGNELYILASRSLGNHSGDPYYAISPSMLGGEANRWTYDDGTEVPLDQLEGRLYASWNQQLSLNNSLGADDPGVQRALGIATVHIIGNTSTTRGGGIGSNGTVYIGTSVESTRVQVVKQWNDGDNADGSRPASVREELYRDGVYVGYQMIVPDVNGTWTCVFDNLPKWDSDGHEFVYTVVESAVDGYVSAVDGSAADGFVIWNSRTVDVAGSKTWADDSDRDGIRPASVTVRLMADGVEVDSRTVTAADGWQWSFEGLYVHAADGHEIAYSVVEDEVAGYDSEVDGYDVTNTHVPETVDISVRKTWSDSDDKDGIRPASVKVQLLADGKPVGDAVTLSAANGWSFTWTSLYKMEEGQLVTYTVREADVPQGYTCKVTGDAQSGFTIENSHGSTTPPMPRTGDDMTSNLFLGFLAAAGVLAVVLGSILIIRRKKG